MYWWVVILALGVLLTPYYVYVVSKCAGAGWMSGLRAYIRSTSRERNRDG